jgi:predicted RNA polymerase sigma factor
LADAHIPFEVPHGDERVRRIGSVLEVVYLIFNEGYAATAGDDWIRTKLCDEALRLGRILARLAPQQAEVHGLVALMEIQASRADARTAADGTPILLLDQDRSLWNQILIRRGLVALGEAERLRRGDEPYTLQAAIAACHARARKPEDTDWRRIAQLYDELAAATPSPVVELNRAVAHSMAHGPEAGLRLLEPLIELPVLKNYHLLPSVRGDFLRRLGRFDEARVEFQRAAELTQNARERELLLKRAAGQA